MASWQDEVGRRERDTPEEAGIPSAATGINMHIHVDNRTLASNVNLLLNVFNF